MKNLTVKGSQKFMGKEIPVVAGGFGENAKCISDKTVAEIHSMREPHVGITSKFRLCKAVYYPGGAYLSLFRTRLCKTHQDYGYRSCLGNPRLYKCTG